MTPDELSIFLDRFYTCAIIIVVVGIVAIFWIERESRRIMKKHGTPCKLFRSDGSDFE